MASVWLAERADGLLDRQVALKLPHMSWGSGSLAERMARERQILASLTHPNIARLYDVGIAADGRPFLALEYVDGQPIGTHAGAQASSVDERVALIVQVARAVAHAHAQLVVHRDLKPSNILVDAEGTVHLLDFGIAKLIEPPGHGAGESAPATLMVGRALTPDYASPEQIRGDPLGTGLRHLFDGGGGVRVAGRQARTGVPARGRSRAGCDGRGGRARRHSAGEPGRDGRRHAPRTAWRPRCDPGPHAGQGARRALCLDRCLRQRPGAPPSWRAGGGAWPPSPLPAPALAEAPSLGGRRCGVAGGEPGRGTGRHALASAARRGRTRCGQPRRRPGRGGSKRAHDAVSELRRAEGRCADDRQGHARPERKARAERIPRRSQVDGQGRHGAGRPLCSTRGQRRRGDAARQLSRPSRRRR